jgi:hypothetical protein
VAEIVDEGLPFVGVDVVIFDYEILPNMDFQDLDLNAGAATQASKTGIAL